MIAIEILLHLLFFNRLFEGVEDVGQIVHLVLDLSFVPIRTHFSQLFRKRLQLLQIAGVLCHLSFGILQ